MTTTRVATWNLNWATGARAERLGSLLRAAGTPQVALLQEVNPSGVERFRQEAGLDWCVVLQQEFSELLAVRGRDGAGSSRRPRGVAIAGTGDPLRSPIAFPDLPLPEKVLAGWIAIGGQPVTVASYHAPTGVQHKKLKPEQAVRLADWLVQLDGPVILAGDFNTPKIDHPDFAKTRTHWHTGRSILDGAPGDDLLVGPDKIHGLDDALRVWLDADPDELARLRVERSDGPLAVSNMPGPKATRMPYRYDAIWISPHFDVIDISYMYEQAVQAGTDHALVLATLSLDERLQRRGSRSTSSHGR